MLLNSQESVESEYLHHINPNSNPNANPNPNPNLNPNPNVQSPGSNNSKKRKLILHFDQHNTIQVACTLPGRRITVEEGLNHFLTSVVWGKESASGDWTWVSNEPQIYRPRDEPDAITYFKWLEKRMVNRPEDRAELKKSTCTFVNDGQAGAHFRHFFDLYLEKLTFDKHWHYQDYQTDNNTNKQKMENDSRVYYYNNNVRRISESEPSPSIQYPPNTIPADEASNHALYHLILPDFFDMISRLQHEKREFTIVLRTMGIDSQNFLDTIAPVIQGHHRDFAHLEPMQINPWIGQIERQTDDSIVLEWAGERFDTEEAIYAKLCSLQGINAIRDDFAYWQQNEYECYAAKPLWVDLDDPLHQHILFDDNIRLDAPDDCIVNLRLRNSVSSQFENVEFDSYRLFEKCSILQPNLIQLLNPHLRSDSTKNHYFEQIKRAEIHFNRILMNKENINIPIRSLESSMQNAINVGPSIQERNSDGPAVDMESENYTNNGNTSIREQRQKLARRIKNKSFIQINKPLGNHLKEQEQEIEKAEQKISTICAVS